VMEHARVKGLTSDEHFIVEHASWLKIRNHTYSQWIGREEFFSHSQGEIPVGVPTGSVIREQDTTFQVLPARTRGFPLRPSNSLPGGAQHPRPSRMHCGD